MIKRDFSFFFAVTNYKFIDLLLIYDYCIIKLNEKNFQIFCLKNIFIFRSKY